jgi:PAS domain S-box-containing protein
MKTRRHHSVVARLQPIAAGERCAPCVREVIVGTATLSAEDRVVSWDTWAERLTGYTLEEIHVRQLAHLFNPVDLFHRHLQLAHAGIPTTSEPFHLRHACGRPVPMGVLCSPMRHVQPGAAGVVLVMWGLASFQKQSRRSNASPLLRDLLGALSHTIHNPLTTIALHAHHIEGALQRPTGGLWHGAKGSLAEIKQALDSVGERLAQLQGAMEAVLHEVYDALQAVTLHRDLVEDVLQRPTEDGPSQMARSLAAIKSETMRLQRLFDLGLQAQPRVYELQGDDHERMPW